MNLLKNCQPRRNRAVALVLVGASYAIQVVPPVLNGWAGVFGTSSSAALAALSLMYAAILAAVFFKASPPRV